ncbi:MAG: SGNH/GDSL hydrolase family protein [Chloroflexi bacterium]|nr:SGNH/GDSL hydrolase family protein [Chloroflexota bacterium]
MLVRQGFVFYRAMARIPLAKTVLFSTVTVVLALLCIEAGTRLYYALRSGAANTVDLHAYWTDDPETGYALLPGFAAGGIRINSLGFRGREIVMPKPGGTYRVVALGDSTTFGPREAECAYPYALADLLQARDIEVINAGIEGYRTERAQVHLERDVLPLQPDLIIVFIGWDDLYQVDPFTDGTESASLQLSPLQRVLSWSVAAQTFRRVYYEHLSTPSGALLSGPGARDRFIETYWPNEYADHLHRIFAAAHAAGADVLALTWPTLLDDDMSAWAASRIQYPYYTRSLSELQTLYADYQMTLRAVAASDQVPVIDVAAAFDGLDKTQLFSDAIHFNCAGHQVVAERLAPEVAERAHRYF